MTETRVKTRRGQAVGLYLQGRDEQVNTAKAEIISKKFVGGDFEEDLYVRRPQDTTLLFYEIAPDNSVYEYGPGDMTSYPSVGPTLAKAQAIDAECVNAFAADTITELIAATDEFPAQTYAYYDGVDYTAGLSQQKIHLFLQSAPYGQFNYIENDQPDDFKGTNKMLIKGRLQNKGSLQAGDSIYWPFFDTSYDPDFPETPGTDGWKITTEPDFSADRAELAFNGGKVKVCFKKLPRVFSVFTPAHFYVPYSFWNDDVLRVNNEPNPTLEQRTWWAGSQVDVRQEFETFKTRESGSDFELHWNARYAATSPLNDQASIQAAIFDTEANDYLQRMIDDNGIIASGYIWPPATYNPPGFWTPAEQAQVERYYPDIPHGWFIYNVHAEITSVWWDYEGAFVAGLEYRGQKYYVWRYTTAHSSTRHVNALTNLSFRVSNESWQAEPMFIWDGDGNFNINPTHSDLHYVEDTTRDQFFDFPAGLPITGPVSFFFPPKRWVDFGTKPRNYQT